MAEKIRGRLTFRIAAVLFILDAVFEMASPTGAVPLFGAFRGGAAAVAYHFAYFMLYAALGVGIWRPYRWGYPLVFICTAVVTLDTLQMLAGMDAVTAWFAALMARYGIENLAAEDLLAKAVAAVSVTVAAGWWGFAAYTYFRRGYFRKTD